MALESSDHRPLYDPEDCTPRQTSSDDEQSYICDHCRQEAAHLDDTGTGWVNRNGLGDYSRESVANPSTLEMAKESISAYNFHDDDYLDDPPSNVRDWTSAMYTLHGESDNVDDSSRESRGPYQSESHRRHHPLHYHDRSPLPYGAESQSMDL
ncbi:uncharacterized protein LOC143376004 [Andrena cerasifolii]|uniref:uncharacterized protein LOC143376004 n=1 Tax=Andrena cerasifolii TaxID=2819439 RepID=UPI0040382747